MGYLPDVEEQPLGRRVGTTAAPAPVVRSALRHGTGRPLAPALRTPLERRFGQDFSQVRVHSDQRAASSVRAVGALAYTVGSDIAIDPSRYRPDSRSGRQLIAHELAHVVQQRGRSGDSPLPVGEHRHELSADRAAEAALRGTPVPHPGSAPAAIQRTVELRDVGSGDQSGFERLPELVDRLNAMATGGTFSVSAGGEAGHRVRNLAGDLVQGNQTVLLQYTPKEGAPQSFFETRLRAFIALAAPIPLRLTNRHGLLGDVAHGFHTQVDVDAWRSGYVDIDDLLGSSDLGLQSVLLHFLTERGATANYAHRIGGANFTNAEFQRVHGLGTGAEAALLQDFFGDPTIHLVNDSPSPTVRRVFRNSRRDLIRRRITKGQGVERGVDASSIEVITLDGARHTAEEYRQILQDARAAAAH